MRDPRMTNHHFLFCFQTFWYLTYLWVFLEVFEVFPYISFFNYGCGPLQFGGLVYFTFLAGCNNILAALGRVPSKRMFLEVVLGYFLQKKSGLDGKNLGNPIMGGHLDFFHFFTVKNNFWLEKHKVLVKLLILRCPRIFW